MTERTTTAAQRCCAGQGAGRGTAERMGPRAGGLPGGFDGEKRTRSRLMKVYAEILARGPRAGSLEGEKRTRPAGPCRSVLANGGTCDRPAPAGCIGSAAQCDRCTRTTVWGIVAIGILFGFVPILILACSLSGRVSS